MSSSREPLRLVRGGVAATVATALALIGHVAGGGAMPGWLGIALPWWLSVTVCTVLAGTRFSLPAVGRDPGQPGAVPRAVHGRHPRGPGHPPGRPTRHSPRARLPW